jgi:FAD/FMN-containing dehydrogenase
MSERNPNVPVRELITLVGAEHVILDPAAQVKFLRDFSWYSPLLTDAFSEVPCDAIVQPGTLDELREIVALAVRARVPLTLRGAGTGNYGQSLPLHGGILVDIRRLNRIVAMAPTSITVEGGIVLGAAEEAARRHGREFRVLPSTYRRATAAGFVAGGSGGLGSVTYGSLWDGNVLACELYTAEDPPRTLTVRDPDLENLLHTYGVAGVIATVTFPLVPARPWAQAVAIFPQFEAAARFAWSIGLDDAIAKRLVSLQEAPIPTFFEAVDHLFQRHESAVLLMVDERHVAATRALVAAAGGRYVPWPERPDITQFPFSHTILWGKHHDPSYTWLQCEFAPAPGFFVQLQRIKERFGDGFLHHVEFHRSGPRLRPMGIPILTRSEPAFVDSVMAYCEQIGVAVMNPHTYVVEEGGHLRDLQKLLAFKAQTDPYGILNPGKVANRFYTGVGGR